MFGAAQGLPSTNPANSKTFARTAFGGVRLGRPTMRKQVDRSPPRPLNKRTDKEKQMQAMANSLGGAGFPFGDGAGAAGLPWNIHTQTPTLSEKRKSNTSDVLGF